MSTHIIDVRLNDNTSNGEANLHDEIAKGLSRPLNEKFFQLSCSMTRRAFVSTMTWPLPPKSTTCSLPKKIFSRATHMKLPKLCTVDPNVTIRNLLRVSYSSSVLGHVFYIKQCVAQDVLLLSALSKVVPEPKTPAPITYYALDLERRELERTLDELLLHPLVSRCKAKLIHAGSGVHSKADSNLWPKGACEDVKLREQQPFLFVHVRRVPMGLPLNLPPLAVRPSKVRRYGALHSRRESETPLHVLFLGSTLGMFLHGEDAAFLNTLPLRADKGDTLLIGIDMCRDIPRIERAYNDTAGVSRRFILNGLKTAGRALGDESLFPQEKWEYKTRFNVEEQRHEAFVCSRIAQTVRDPQTGIEFAFLEGERVFPWVFLWVDSIIFLQAQQ
ncbi:histidine-specific methyltransferase [Lactifluus volemus]|nr:histidine-specific methyltransferase [Lactifluus volemus]